MDLNAEIGARVRWLRMAQSFTQERLAADAGVSQQYLSDLERGRRNPTVHTLEMVARALNVTINALFEFAEK